MNLEQQTRARNSVLGAFVADAASMGLHWVYSQRRIQELAPANPEFRKPDPADYSGGVGYFAHPTRVAGDLSHYGEQMLVMLRSITATQRRYSKTHYTEQFRQHFGYGGEFVGYIDRPTRQTLDRIYRDEHDAIETANVIAYAGAPAERASMLTKVLAAMKQHEGQQLRERVEAYAAAMPEPERSLDYGLRLVTALAPSDDFPGAADEQLPAVSKLPPLVACHVDDDELVSLSESAIRVTNNAPRALDFGRVCVALLQSSIQGATMATVLEAAVKAGSAATAQTLNRALESSLSVREQSREFGLHCDLGAGIPGILHNIRTASSFTEAIRNNIYAGGDNCGRSIILGAVCGARFGMGGPDGIPGEWLQRLTRFDEIHMLVGKLFED